jgi:esterase
MQLHFTTLGAGEPLLLLHGLLGSHQNLLPASRRFAEHFQVFAIDQRNHGHSPHQDEMNYALMADDIARFMDTRGLSTAHVLGHSMGGKTAMQFALTHGDRTRKLIVVDMAPKAYGPRFAQLLQALRALRPERFKTRPEADLALAAHVPEESLRQFLLKNLMPDEQGGYRWRIHLEAIADNYEHLRQNITARGTFTGEVHFLLGDQSDYVTDADRMAIKERFPNATFESIHGAGHWVHAERPVEFAEAVMTFLSQ